MFGLLGDLVAPEPISKKTFEELCEVLSNHYEPKPSKFIERNKFESRCRHLNENVHEFVAALRKLALHCEFGNTLEERLCERLVRGMNDAKIQQKLITTKNLTLQQAIETAQSMQSSVENIKELVSNRWEENEINIVNSQKRNSSNTNIGFENKKKPVCYRCGGFHYATTCRFKETECNVCHKKGHLAKVCLSKEIAENKRNLTSHNLITTNETEVTYDLCTIIAKENPITVNLQLNATNIQFQVDTGAAVTLINSTDYQKYFKKPLRQSNIRLNTFTGESLNVLGDLDVHVSYKNKHFVLPLVIVDGAGPPLLGRNWIKELNPEWMSIFSIDNGSTKTDSKLQEIIRTYKSVFSDEAGCLKDYKVKLHLKDGASPRFMKARQPPFGLREQIEQELKRLQENDIIEKVQFSEWATPIVPIVKSDLSIRICGDYKVTVNKAIFQDEHPIPKLDEMCNKLAHGKKFSRLDLSHAYTQLELDPGSKDLTTINTHCGLFRYKRLCFGISACPAIFQRTLESVFSEVKGIAIYIDDLIITGPDDETHLNNLRDVLRICQERGLTIKESKCEFFKDEVNFLGYRLNAQGLQPQPEKLKAVHDAPEPRNVSELKSYLGMLNYYAKYIHNLSHHLAPLYDLLKKGNKWHWGKDQQTSFIKSKNLLTSDLLLVHFDPTKPLLMACDASPRGISAILSHVFSDGSERPIAYASRSLSAAERNYAQIDREALAIIFGTTRFHKYIYGNHVKILTDHKPLLGLLGHGKSIPERASSRVVRWAVTLSAYNYELIYRAGSLNNADALSRLPLSAQPGEVPFPQDIFQVFTSIDSSTVTSTMIAEETKKDILLSRVYKFTLLGWPDKLRDESFRPYFSRKSELSVDKGCVLWGTRVIIPTSLRTRVIDLLHEEHIGIVRMKSQARAYVWWPHIDSDLERTVKSCFTCQSTRNAPPQAPLHPWTWPESPWSRLHLDFAGPMLGKMFLIIADAHSKWIDIKIMNKITGADTILQLRHVFATHGLPDIIVTDNGPSFCSKEFSTFLTYNGVQHIRSSPFHPASNGFAERCVQTFKSSLKTMSSGSVEEKVLRFLTKYRSTPQSTTGMTPAELLFNRKIKTRLDLVHPFVNGRVAASQTQQKKYHDAHAAERVISVNDNVFVRNYSYGPKWLPGVVTEQTGPVSFKVRTGNGLQKRHQDQIRVTDCEWDEEEDDSLLHDSSLPVGSPTEDMNDESVTHDPTTGVDDAIETGANVATNSPMEDVRRSQRIKKPVKRLITEI